MATKYINIPELSGWKTLPDGNYTIRIVGKAPGYAAVVSNEMPYTKNAAEKVTITLTTPYYSASVYFKNADGTEEKNESGASYSVSKEFTVGDSVTIGVRAYGSYNFSAWTFGTQKAYTPELTFIASNTIEYVAEVDYNPCLIAGTLITLADRTTKPIELISYNDDILCWDFDNGCFTSSKPVWLQRQLIASQYNELIFEDGKVLNTVNQHRIFNKEAGKFTYPMTDDTPIGTTTFTHDNTFTKLKSKSVIKEEIPFYNMDTYYHLNYFANGILVGCRMTNIYQIEDMKYIYNEKRKGNVVLVHTCLPEFFKVGYRLDEQLETVSTEGNDKNMSVDEYLYRYKYRLSR